MWNRFLLLSVLLLTGCDRDALGPTSDATPVFGASAGLVERSDSLAKSGYVSWYEGDTWISVSVSEATINGEKEVWLGYAGYDADWNQSYMGWGRIPAKDVRGSGLGVLEVLTNTSPEANPEFLRIDDPGGIVHVVWHQTPQTTWTMRDRGRFELPPHLIFYNTKSKTREARVEGALVGRVIPQGTTGYLGLAWAHSMLLLTP